MDYSGVFGEGFNNFKQDACILSLSFLFWFFLVDVKPSNMLVSTSGKVKICDFGVSIQVWCVPSVQSQITFTRLLYNMY